MNGHDPFGIFNLHVVCFHYRSKANNARAIKMTANTLKIQPTILCDKLRFMMRSKLKMQNQICLPCLATKQTAGTPFIFFF
jgi:hypothetical protein